MFGKIFAQMYDGTLVSNWKALVTFQQMIVLCGPDGVIDMTPSAIAVRTGIPLRVIKEGVAELESADPQSRTPDAEGRRIERLDEHRAWGWRIVNYRKYRLMADSETVRKQNAERSRRYRERHAKNVTQRDERDNHAISRQAEAEAEAEKKKISVIRPMDERSFREFWDAYPRKVARPAAVKAWQRLSPDTALREMMLAALERAKASDQWRDRQFIPHPATWLNGRRWEDELASGPERRGHANAVPGTRFVA